jgi:hypothetical protein
MSGLVSVLVVLAVVALIVVRQVRPQRAGRSRWWLVPVVLLVLALRGPALLDAHHRTASVLFLAAELLVGVVMGVAWAWTSRIWTEPDGSVWTRGTKATAAVWVGGILLRVGLAALAAVMGIHQGSGTLLLALAGSLLVRSGLLAWRAEQVKAVPAYGAAYRDGRHTARRGSA